METLRKGLDKVLEFVCCVFIGLNDYICHMASCI